MVIIEITKYKKSILQKIQRQHSNVEKFKFHLLITLGKITMHKSLIKNSHSLRCFLKSKDI